MSRLLVLNFFPAFYPPSSGGEQRYYYLYRHVSKYHDVTLLSLTHPNVAPEIVEFSPAFREYRVPRETAHVEMHWQLDRENVGPEVSAVVCALVAGKAHGYHRTFRELLTKADIVIHECPHLIEYDDTAGSDDKPRVYNSYNLEYFLARDTFHRGAGDTYSTLIHDLERRLVGVSDRVFVTCRSEQEAFQEWYQCPPELLRIVPNGFDLGPISSDAGRPDGLPPNQPFVVFLGSAHPPNVDAAEFIIRELAPSFPEVTFVFMGRVSERVESRVRNVALLGKVSDETKGWLLANCRAALNPMFKGAGTNLKVVDYMAYAAPVITTPFGVRGLEAVDGEHCFIRPLGKFADTLRYLLTSPGAASEIGRKGRDHANRHYSWASIGAKVAEELDGLKSRRTKSFEQKPKLVLLNDYPVDDPKGGGQVRIYYLYRALAKDFEVTLFCLTNENKRRETILGPGIRQIAIPKTRLHREKERAVNSLSPVSAEDIISLLYCMDNAELVGEFTARVRDCAVVVFSHPYLAPIETLIPRNVVRVYEAANHESSLKPVLLADHPLKEELVSAVRSSEEHLLQAVDQLVCVSAEDARLFESAAPAETIVIKNGVEIREGVDTPARSPNRAIFVGSAHPPNIEALRFITDELAPELPDVEFVVLGSVCSAIGKDRLPVNVLLKGFVPDEEKQALMASAAIALNPMFSGGGSNLKLADYFAAGLPVISTGFGIRGFDLQDGVQLEVAERRQFTAAIRSLLGSAEKRASLAAAAREFVVTQLSWQMLAAEYARSLFKLIDRPLLPKKKSALLVTYRYNEAAAGGAELYFEKLARAVGDRETFEIDIATCDVEGIENRAHFSAAYSAMQITPALPSFAREMFVFPAIQPSAAEVDQGARLLFQMWAVETLEQARSLQGVYQRPLLMGGWYLLEKDRSGRESRWTSGCCEMFCPPEVAEIQLQGYSPSKKKVEFNYNSKPVGQALVCGNFDIRVSVPPEGGVLQVNCKADSAPNDPRELGLYVTSVALSCGKQRQNISLADDFEAAVRARSVSDWVSSLIQITNRRDPGLDSIFRRIRGPISPGMVDFLRRRGGDYDVVLVQGVPFSTTPDAVDALRSWKVPLVLLPHFHMEDRYYHWQSFYEAFRAADLVLGFPADVKPYFFDKIGAKSELIAGGGIDPVEFDHIDMCQRSFQALYADDTPFVLILGRKTGAKRYRMTIDAVRRLSQDGLKLNVVMIGADEDGVAVSDSFVRNIGRQHRGVIVGALASSVCLINMSESESFGIVLLESWMCGRPVIAARTCSAFASLVSDGEDGLLCTTEADLAESIRRMVRDPERAARMGAAGREKALRSFSWQALGDRVNQLLQSVVRTPTAAEKSEDVTT